MIVHYLQFPRSRHTKKLFSFFTSTVVTSAVRSTAAHLLPTNPLRRSTDGTDPPGVFVPISRSDNEAARHYYLKHTIDYCVFQVYMAAQVLRAATALLTNLRNTRVPSE